MSLPLASLLSQTLVALTIELDNEFERETPHRTTDHPSTPGAPWLVSRAMWSNFLQHVDEDGTPVQEWQHRVGMKPKDARQWLTRMSNWWGYVTVEPGSTGGRSKRTQSGGMIRFTEGGLRAQRVWRALAASIETRWRERFGEDAIDELRASLRAVASQLNAEVPVYLPILGYGLFSRATGRGAADDSLPALLSKMLLAFAMEFERESEVSLAIGANVLRVVEDRTRIRDLPRLAGVSKEGIEMALSFLEKRGYATIQPESRESRVRVVVLTATGQGAKQSYLKLMSEIEDRWRTRFGGAPIDRLRAALEHAVVENRRLLLSGLEPSPEGWRATLPRPEALPHYPMMLHRGGYPDGS